MPGADEVGGPRARIDRDLDGRGAVEGGDAGRDALGGSIETVKAVPCGVVVVARHRRQAERVAPVSVRARQITPRPCGHEVDGLGGHVLGGDHEVALVLAVLVIDEDDELAATDVLDSLLDRGKGEASSTLRVAIAGTSQCRAAFPVRSPIEPGSEQALHVLRKHVDLEVDLVPGGERPERRHRERVRDEGNRETVLAEARHGEADAVDADRALLDAIAGEPVRDLDLDPHAISLGHGGRDPADAVDMPLHDVTPERLARPQRRLDVRPGTGAETTERRPLERLRNRIERQDLAVDLRDGQADAVDRNRVTYAAAAAVSGASRRSLTPSDPPSIDATRPSSRMIPVNTR